MARQHASFLLRCWFLGSDSERIEIVHVQSGTKVLTRSVGSAIEWICAHGDAMTVDDPDGDPLCAVNSDESELEVPSSLKRE